MPVYNGGVLMFPSLFMCTQHEIVWGLTGGCVQYLKCSWLWPQQKSIACSLTHVSHSFPRSQATWSPCPTSHYRLWEIKGGRFTWDTKSDGWKHTSAQIRRIVIVHVMLWQKDHFDKIYGYTINIHAHLFRWLSILIFWSATLYNKPRAYTYWNKNMSPTSCVLC